MIDKASKNGDSNDSEIELSEIISVLKAGKYLILLSMGIMLFFACIYLLTIPPKYETSALIQVNNKGDSMGGLLKNLDPSMGAMSSFGRQASLSKIESALIKSRFILEPTIESLGLHISVTPRRFPILGSIFITHHKGDEVAKPFLGMNSYAWGGEEIKIQQFKVPVKYFGKCFKLIPQTPDTYKLYSPKGKLVLEGAVGQAVTPDSIYFQGLSINVAKMKSNVGTEFTIVVHRVNSYAGQLAANLMITDIGTMDKTENYPPETGVLNVALKGTDAELLPTILNTIISYDIDKNAGNKTIESQKTLDFLEEQAAVLKNELDKAETAFSIYKMRTGGLSVKVSSKVLLDKLVDVEKNIESIKLKRIELLQTYTDRHPFIIAIDQEQAKLRKELAFLEDKVKTLPSTEQETLSLQRDVRVKNQLYLLLLSKLQQFQVIKAGTISDVRVLADATPAIRLSSHAGFIVLVSMLAGFLMAVVFLVILRILNKAMEDPDYVEERLGIPLYSIVPHSRKQGEIVQSIKRGIVSDRSYVLAEVDGKDLAIEGLRSLCTTLQFSMQEAKNNIIAVLGSVPSIGKSFISLNLAFVLANVGKKVLLIDADLRRGKIHRYVHQNSYPGFAEYLSGKMDLQQVIKHVGNSKVDFVAAGKYPSNPAELLFTQNFKKFLEEVSPQYDIVLFDTSPILAVADGLIVAKEAGTNLLLIGSGVEDLREIEHAVKRLQKNNVQVQGLIFNNVKGKQYTYGYGKYGYYNYGYYTAKEEH